MSTLLTLETKDDVKITVEQLNHNQLSQGQSAQNKVIQRENLTRLPSDHRFYRYLVLENGLRVLLINNDRAATSSASLHILAGSYQDPEGVDGLAHFLEHAAFMGCEKYQEEGGFQKFVKKHSGEYEGATGDDYTRYAFSIIDEHFEEASDQLQSFITKPLFMESSIEREVNAIHNEFCEGLEEDSQRVGYILKLIVNPKHPESRFDCGNRETLKEARKLIPKLKAFHQQYYVGNRMILILQSKLALDKLEALAVNYFSSIPKSSHPVNDPPLPIQYHKDSLGLMLQIESVEAEDYLAICFVIDQKRSIEVSHALSYISDMLNHPGQGGLFDNLLKQDLIKDATSKGSGYGAEVSLIDDNQAKITIGFPLSERGKNAIAEITAITLQYIEFIKNQGIDLKFFKRIQETSERSLKFSADMMEPGFFENLRHFSIEKFFVGSMILPDSFFPEALIRKLLANLTVDKMLIFCFRSEEFEEQEEPEVEPITEAYLDRPILFKRFPIQSLAPEVLSHPLEFSLPEENPFIPKEFALIPHSNNFSYPKLISNEPHRIWYSQDLKFKKPLVVTHCYLLSNLVKKTVENAVVIGLLVELINNQIEKQFEKDFDFASSSVTISASMRGLYIEVNGYSHKHRDIVLIAVGLLSAFSVEEQEFENARMNAIEYYRSFHTNPSVQQCLSKIKLILNQYHYSHEAIIAVLERINIQSLMEYIQKFLASVKLEMYCHGNLTADETIQLGEAIAQKLNINAAGFVPPETAIVHLQLGTSQCHNFKIQQKMNSAILFLQIPDQSIKTNWLLFLLEKVIAQPFFEELRTKKQLGYTVECSQFIFEHSRGLMFIISSADYTSDYLIEEMEKFIADFLPEILKISGAKFLEIKTSLTKLINVSLASCHSPSDYASIFNTNLNLEIYNFKLLAKYHDPCKDITLEDLQNFYKALIAENSIRKLIVKTENNFTPEDVAQAIFDALSSNNISKDLLCEGEALTATEMSQMLPDQQQSEVDVKSLAEVVNNVMSYYNSETKVNETKIDNIDTFKAQQTNYSNPLRTCEPYIQCMFEFNRFNKPDLRKGELVDVYAFDVIDALKPTVLNTNKTAADLVLTYSFGNYKDSLSPFEAKKLEEALAKEQEAQRALFAQAKFDAAIRKRKR